MLGHEAATVDKAVDSSEIGAAEGFTSAHCQPVTPLKYSPVLILKARQCCFWQCV